MTPGTRANCKPGGHPNRSLFRLPVSVASAVQWPMTKGKKTQKTLFSQIILIKLTVSSKSAITGKPPYFTCLNCLPLSLLVRCWRWDPLLNLLPSGGIRHVLFWSATHVEFMVCPNEFANNRRLYCWRIVSHAVKPTMPEGGERRQLWRGRAACWGGGAILLLELES